uniref:Uncharacterized protein n=1 Tax=Rhizophora mucronata TaxID=61149 RepID=A0A2P2PC39_RHIMU
MPSYLSNPGSYPTASILRSLGIHGPASRSHPRLLGNECETGAIHEQLLVGCSKRSSQLGIITFYSKFLLKTWACLKNSSLVIS